MSAFVRVRRKHRIQAGQTSGKRTDVTEARRLVAVREAASAADARSRQERIVGCRCPVALDRRLDALEPVLAVLFVVRLKNIRLQRGPLPAQHFERMLH